MQDRTSFSAWQEKLDRSLQDVRLKGRERLTIMVIPHGHERIVSLHLNWYLVVFLLGLILASAIFAVLLFYTEQEEIAERARLEAVYGQNFRTQHEAGQHLRELIVRLQLLQEKWSIAGNMQDVPRESLALFLDEDALHEQFQETLSRRLAEERSLDPAFQFIPTIERIKEAVFYVENSQRALSEMPLLLTRPGIITHLPFGRPVVWQAEMRDSSAFGLRMNPFGGAAFDFHTGYDITSRHGTLIHATASGRVKTAAYSGSGYGNYVIIDHGFEMYSLYAHMARIFVAPGDEVRRGTELGTMGATGNVTGVHLHYEIMLGEERRIDPLPFICALDRLSPACSNRT
ncbi:MAG: M23 family metallopeptidase [Spirochaetales bacterium]|nr:M23 family metallopeptidase [Spirochaetales bacterium]